MHEFPVTRSLLDAALAEGAAHGARRITRLKVVVGEMSGFVPESIAFYFATLAKGTPAEAARLEFVTEKMAARCRGCGAEFTPRELAFTCERCGGVELEITAGRGAMLVEADLES